MMKWFESSGYRLDRDGTVRADYMLDSVNRYMAVMEKSSKSAESLGRWLKKMFKDKVTHFQGREGEERPYYYGGISMPKLPEEDGKE